jgi:CheY-like chemotaxis protein
MLEIPAATIRNWEERYATIIPERSPGGHRLYSRDQVGQLRFIAAEIARGFSAADAHRLLVESEKGVQLPVESEEGVPPATNQSNGRGPLVLVAERDPAAAELEEHFLRTEGYEVSSAFAVGDVESHWRESRPQLAIVELMISGGLGVELCHRLKRHHAGAVLAVSALEARDAALAAGADAFLKKPFHSLELVSTVENLLGESALAGSGGRESH